jgi:hypothetical protein
MLNVTEIKKPSCFSENDCWRIMRARDRGLTIKDICYIWKRNYRTVRQVVDYMWATYGDDPNRDWGLVPAGSAEFQGQSQL